jgi:RecB family exonuclease
VDPPRGFLEALHQKYASEFEEERERQKDSHVVQPNESIQFNGKVVEEVGFEKIRKQLAELQDLRIVLVDGLRVAGILSDNRDAAARRQELEKIEQTCPKIAELDLSRNLLYRWQDVQDICKQLKQLRSLKLK